MTINYPPDLVAQVRELQRQVRALLTQRRVASASVDGERGAFRVIDPASGSEVFLVGDLGDAYVAPDDERQYGFIVRRSTGEAAIGVVDTDPVGGGFNPYFAVYDRSGNIVLSDDANSRQGIARPWLPIPFIDVRQSGWPTATSTSFVDVWYADYIKQHPYLYVLIQVIVGGSTTGEWRLLKGGDEVGAATQVTGSASTYVQWTVEVQGDFGDVMDLHIQARRPTGTGSVLTMVTGAWGRQSP